MTHRALRFSALTYTYYTCTNKHKGKGPHLSNSKGGSFVACTGCLRPPCTLPTAVHTVGFPKKNQDRSKVPGIASIHKWGIKVHIF
jgi:hypothetical protein